jgi:hypothetical protein
MLTGQEPEDLPHKGLAIDVAKALPDDPAMVRVISKLVEPDPDVRPVRILPLLRNVLPQEPKKPKRAHREDRRRRRHEDMKQRRRERKAERRAERAARRQTRSESSVPPLVLPIVVIALGVARVAVNVTLRAVVPTLLTLMSLVFGKGLRDAAKAVGRAGVVADEGLHRATLRVMGRSPDEAPSEGVRVKVEEREQQRIAVEDAVDQAQDDVSAALEEVAEELEAWRKPKRRRK